MAAHGVAEFVGSGLEVAPAGVERAVVEQLLELDDVGPSKEMQSDCR